VDSAGEQIIGESPILGLRIFTASTSMQNIALVQVVTEAEAGIALRCLLPVA
jgi:hypothetical protein